MSLQKQINELEGVEMTNNKEALEALGRVAEQTNKALSLAAEACVNKLITHTEWQLKEGQLRTIIDDLETIRKALTEREGMRLIPEPDMPKNHWDWDRGQNTLIDKLLERE